MDIVLQRLWFTDRSTCGEFSVEGRIGPYTLELPVKDGKPGSAILPGRYQIVLAPSPKFQQSKDPWVMKYAGMMPHLIIPDRSLIMIHWGNYPADTDGCILVGQVHELDMVGNSRPAFESFYTMLQAGLVGGPVFLNVQGGLPLSNSGDVQTALAGD